MRSRLARVALGAPLFWLCLAAALESTSGVESRTPPLLPDPILFVTQFPIAADFATIGSTFANHEASVAQVGRGGDLMLLYPDGSLRNLTQEAGYGATGAFQGADSIAVRDPAVHWNGSKALFSMVVGAPTARFEQTTEYWQIYEVSGLGAGQTAVITKMPNQPLDYNNVTPIYSPDGRILFTSDRPRSGGRHLYPQHDEYESTATNTGLWSLDPETGDLHILNHSPSGVFTPRFDSYGRVIFTRWDHLQRDQQADADELGGDTYGTFNYADESAGAAKIDSRDEVFPEPRAVRVDLLGGTNLLGHSINHFFPWEINLDGTAEETLNHIGRHELHDYFDRVFDDDDSLEEFIDSVSGRFNTEDVLNFFQIREDPQQAGRYVGVDAPEFQTHAAGQIVAMSGPPSLPADQMQVTYITDPVTSDVDDSGSPPANHSGHYRDPAPLTDGTLIAAHTFETGSAGNDSPDPRHFPDPRYEFRLRRVDAPAGAYVEAGAALTSGIAKTIQYWDPDEMVTYSGELWELQPVEVRTRPKPPLRTAPPLDAPEAQIFDEEGISPQSVRNYLRDGGLALVVSRNVTTRDAADRQQPFNLQVDIASGAQTTGDLGTIYPVRYLQFFQGDQIRGIGGIADPNAGRRVLAQAMHDPTATNPPTTGPAGSVTLAADGSMAAFVPARRAMSWQLTDAAGTPVVRERYWLTFQPGEIRLCASCHGLNSVDQAGSIKPSNPPEALRQLLQFWSSNLSGLFADGFESGETTVWSGSTGGS